MANKTALQIVLEVVDNATAVFKKVGDKVAKMGDKMSRVGKTMTVGLTLPLLAMAATSVAAASTFETGMTNVATLIDTNVESMADMSAAVLKMATSTDQAAVPLGDMTGALFDIRSAGIDSADAMAVLGAAAKLGVAGLGTTKQAADLGTSAINAFNLKGEDATRVFNTFFTATKFGKTTIAEMSRGFGSVAGIVNQSNIKLEEFAATTAALTTTGLKASEAYTQQRAILSGLTRQTEGTAKVFKKLGVRDFPTLVKQSGGFIQALKQVKTGLVVVGADSKRARKALKTLGATSFKGLVTQLGTPEKAFAALADVIGNNDKALLKALGSTEALSALLALTGSQGVKAAAALSEMQNVGDNLATAFDKQNATSAASWQRTKNTITKAGIAIGTALTPVMGDLADMLASVAGSIGDLDSSTIKWLVSIGAVLAAIGPVLVIGGKVVKVFALLKTAVVLLTPAVLALNAAILANPAALVAVGIAGMIVAVVAAATAIVVFWGPIMDFFASLWSGVKFIFRSFNDWLRSIFFSGSITESLRRLWSPIGGFFSALWGGVTSIFSSAWDGIVFVFEAAWAKIQVIIDKVGEATDFVIDRATEVKLLVTGEATALPGLAPIAEGGEGRGIRGGGRSRDIITGSATSDIIAGRGGEGGKGGTVRVEFGNLPSGARVSQTEGDQDIDLQAGPQVP